MEIQVSEQPLKSKNNISQKLQKNALLFLQFQKEKTHRNACSDTTLYLYKHIYDIYLTSPTPNLQIKYRPHPLQ